MDPSRQQLFAGTAFSGDEHARFACGHPAGHVQQFPELLARTDDAVEAIAVVHDRTKLLVLFFQATHPKRRVEGDPKFVAIERFCYVVEGPLLHGVDSALDGAVGRDDYDGDAVVLIADLLEDLHPVHAGHGDIRDHRIKAVLFEQAQALFSAGNGIHAVPRLGQGEFHHPAQAVVIIYEQDRGFFHGLERILRRAGS